MPDAWELCKLERPSRRFLQEAELGEDFRSVTCLCQEIRFRTDLRPLSDEVTNEEHLYLLLRRFSPEAMPLLCVGCMQRVANAVTMIFAFYTTNTLLSAAFALRAFRAS